MTPATLLLAPVAPAESADEATICVACFSAIDGPSDTGAYCAACACHRCGEDASGSAATDGYCEHCAPALAEHRFFG